MDGMLATSLGVALLFYMMLTIYTVEDGTKLYFGPSIPQFFMQ